LQHQQPEKVKKNGEVAPFWKNFSDTHAYYTFNRIWITKVCFELLRNFQRFFGTVETAFNR